MREKTAISWLIAFSKQQREGLMHSIIEPLTEEEILAPTAITASGAQIKQNMESNPQCCVDHLCGCAPHPTD